MAEHKTVAVEDEEGGLPVVDNVKVLNTYTESTTSTDAFARDASELKKGLDANAKRRITTMSKRFEGSGGAGTKQSQEKDSGFLSAYSAFEVMEPPYNMGWLATLYDRSAVHHAAVDAKVSNIVGLGYQFTETRKTKRKLEAIKNETKMSSARRTLEAHKDELELQIEEFNKEDNFTEVLVKVWRDYETTGNGYLEIGRKKDGSIGYVGHIPSKTLRIRKKRDGFVQVSGFETVFFANFGSGTDENGKTKTIRNPIGTGTPNEVIHIKKYSPTSGYYGVPDIISASQAVAGNEFAGRYNLDFFENKAIPRYAIILKGATLSATAESRLLQFFETKLKGQNHRSIFIPLPASSKENPVELTFEEIGSSIQDASFTNYRRANLSDILMAHRVFESKVSISEGTQLAGAKDADKTFKEQVCAPEQDMFEKKLNRIIKELTDAYELELTQMTLTDEDTQSQIDERYLKNGVDLPNEVRVRRGKPGVEGGNERIDPNIKAKESLANQQATRERDSQRSAGRTDSAGAARNAKGEGRKTP